MLIISLYGQILLFQELKRSEFFLPIYLKWFSSS